MVFNCPKVCFTLRANRETDGARVVVAAALAAVMDALLRRPLGGVLQARPRLFLTFYFSWDRCGVDLKTIRV